MLGKYSDEDLKKLHEYELDILKEFDRICKKHSLSYSLYGGTQIGAIRHKGFIPWDDDIDVAMPRKDYDKFIEVWENENVDGYILQNKENTPEFTQTFTKIRKNHTTFIQNEWEKGLYHTGIFIDIFPIDRIPNGKIKRKLFLWQCIKYLLYTREFVPLDSNPIVKSVSKLLLVLSNKKTREKKRKNFLNKIKENSADSSLNMIGIDTISSLSKICPPDLMDRFIEIEFEGVLFYVNEKYDEWLKIWYDDYMQLPPIEERIWTHHPIVLDFEKNYEELL